MLPLKEWLKLPETQRIKNTSKGKRYTVEFFREPMVPIYVRPECFLSPADGIILYAHPRVKPNEGIVVVKGRKFTPRDLLDDKEYSLDSLCIGIYMTELDVHVNRTPTTGYLSEVHKTPYLFTHNFSMVLEQDDLLNGKGSNEVNLEYLFPNERQITRVYCAKLKCQYYIVQIAERDIDSISNWTDHEMHQQGEKFGQVRYGSQVDLVIPLKKDENRFEVLAKVNYHVQAGVDAIVKVKNVRHL